MCPASAGLKAYEKTDRYPEWKTSPDTFADETAVRCYLYIWKRKGNGSVACTFVFAVSVNGGEKLSQVLDKCSHKKINK